MPYFEKKADVVEYIETKYEINIENYVVESYNKALGRVVPFVMVKGMMAVARKIYDYVTVTARLIDSSQVKGSITFEAEAMCYSFLDEKSLTKTEADKLNFVKVTMPDSRKVWHVKRPTDDLYIPACRLEAFGKGHAMALPSSEKPAPLEDAETSAWGRALTNAGILIEINAGCSAEEMEKAGLLDSHRDKEIEEELEGVESEVETQIFDLTEKIEMETDSVKGLAARLWDKKLEECSIETATEDELELLAKYLDVLDKVIDNLPDIPKTELQKTLSIALTQKPNKLKFDHLWDLDLEQLEKVYEFVTSEE